MKSGNNTFRAWPALGMSAIIANLFNAGILSLLLVWLLERAGDGAWGRVWGTIMVLAVLYELYLAIVLIRMNAGEHALQLLPDAIVLYERTIEAGEVERIFIRGYFAQSTAIKLRHTRRLTLRSCFRFKQQEDEAMAQLHDWAASYNIPVERKRFYVWA